MKHILSRCRRSATTLAVVGASALALAACGSGPTAEDAAPYGIDTAAAQWQGTTVPGVYKACDGTTLLYLSRARAGFALAAVPASPECAR